MNMPDIVRVGVLCIVYFVTAKLGLSLDAVSGFATAVWPPTGIALVALVLYGYRLWPGIALGAFLVNLSAGAPVLVAGGMALGNTLEALLGAVLLNRGVGFHPALDRLRDVLGLVILAAGLSTLVSATIGVSSGWLGGIISTAAYRDAWYTWWLGDALGDLLLAPLLFVWSRRGRAALPWRWSAEAVVLLAAISVLSLLVFDFLAPALPLPRYLLFPALIWVALRLGPRGVATALVIVAACAIWGTARGVGPFTGPTLHQSLFLLQSFMSIVAVTILILAAALAERRRGEALVQEQRERLEVTLCSIGDGVVATDNQGRVTFLNPVAAAATGWPAAEALGKDITQVFRIINEYTRQTVENPVTKVLREGTVVGLANHTLLIGRDGVEHPIDDSGAPIRNAQGHLVGVVLVFRDITERRRAEEAQRRLAAIVESSEDAIIGKTLDGVITNWNQGAEHMYGYTAEEVIGKSVAILVPPERPNELPEILARLVRGEAIAHYETTRVRQDGQVITVSLAISPIRNPGGMIVGAATIARDITAQKQAEDGLLQAHDALTQLVRERTAALQEKEVLLKEVHHRVKNNLQIISSLLSLQSDAITDPHLLTQFQDSQDRIRSMALVHETLYQSQDFARMDMAPYIHALSTQLLQAYVADPQHITLQIQVQQLFLELDQAIPCGIILNELLTNALKYAFPQSQAGVVSIELRRVTESRAILSVRDTGVGFPTGFDFRHTATLGLQLVGMLTEQLGGTITLDQAGETAFTLTFPVLPAEFGEVHELGRRIVEA